MLTIIILVDELLLRTTDGAVVPRRLRVAIERREDRKIECMLSNRGAANEKARRGCNRWHNRFLLKGGG